MVRDLLIVLLQRIVELQAKGRFSNYLQNLKAARALSPRSFLTSGTEDELVESLASAIQSHSLTLVDITSFVDIIEENGAQHLILYSLNNCDVARIAEIANSQGVEVCPSYYSLLPDGLRPLVFPRGDKFLIKQVETADYWAFDEERSFSTDNEKAQFWLRRSRRAVNCVVIDPISRTAEVRLSRVASDAPKDLWKVMYTSLQNSLTHILDLNSAITPDPLWRGFRSIVLERYGTFMATDSARNPEIRHQIASRREAGLGTDIRDLDQYDMDSADYVRESLNIWWIVPSEIGDEGKVHTILSKETLVLGSTNTDVCKIWLSRHVSPEVLGHVVGRIRQIAG